MVDATRRERHSQRLGDVLLPDHLGELRRAVLAIQSEGHEPRLPIDPDRNARGKKGDPAHPPEPADPCCLPALGEFTGWTPRGIRGRV
ncbi:hypothetical protein GCM10023175_20540 [Pseudonocardia xishanensis]|uniref:Uncharacterized protein n=1 Tax=Pseudonocardia xishanensis TaxID=630995 RepID=A0ABP8RNK4_9PSEU